MEIKKEEKEREMCSKRWKFRLWGRGKGEFIMYFIQYILTIVKIIMELPVSIHALSFQAAKTETTPFSEPPGYDCDVKSESISMC